MLLADTNNARDKPEEVQHILISQIHPFPEHPFQVRDDELMQQTIDSIQQVGILTPVILRPDESGEYEMTHAVRSAVMPRRITVMTSREFSLKKDFFPFFSSLTSFSSFTSSLTS